MVRNENVILIRKEFFELYGILRKKSILRDDIISMGNLALFVDYSYNRFEWKEKKNKIIEFANQKDKNEVNMLIAQHLYDIAIRLELSDNLNFKLKKMKEYYHQNKLTYFDVVLDSYEFPEWFKRIMLYFPKLTKKELYSTFWSGLTHHLELIDVENQVDLAYFVDRFYNNEENLFYMTELDYLIQYKDKNEVAWFLAKNIFSVYFPEMGKLNNKEQQQSSLVKLEKYNKLYQAKKLDTFNIVSTIERKNFLWMIQNEDA